MHILTSRYTLSIIEYMILATGYYSHNITCASMHKTCLRVLTKYFGEIPKGKCKYLPDNSHNFSKLCHLMLSKTVLELNKILAHRIMGSTRMVSDQLNVFIVCFILMITQ